MQAGTAIGTNKYRIVSPINPRIRESQDTAKKLQDDARKTQYELNTLRANARPYVTRPLDVKVTPLGFITTYNWKIDWTLWVMNPSSEPVTVHINVYCAASRDESPMLNEWRGLKPALVEAMKPRLMMDSIILERKHCADGRNSRIVAFAKTSGASAIPIDVWPRGAD